ncbi:MAG TPA: PQQ-dependent sugar dehydrogenase [Candidatus Dormibacteraeota bacterium]|nr:PQQ-dependent sugar dehydrogenase [Candidatus Dormibacteraeota bacterium]
MRVRPWLLILFVITVAIGLPIACGYLRLPGGWTVNFPGFGSDPMPDDQLREQLHVPDGFSINTYVGGIDNARLLRFTPTGDLLVSAPRSGTVWLVERDADGDGYADGKRVLLDGLYQPHGLTLHDGWLYVAETTAVVRVPYDATTRTLTGPPERIITGLPDGGNHWTRTVDVGLDGKLYVSIGSSCNVCIEKDPRRAAIMRFDLDGSHGEIYATGLRNSVDFEWQPGTGDLYATDNGRDLLGDDFPPCELNKIVAGGFYGWPIANGDRVPDPDFGAGNEARIAASIPPAHPFGPHVAPLGMTFYRRPPGAAPAAFPAEWEGVAFVAEHGSWNRSQKIGYQVVALRFAPDGTISEEPFLTGFLKDEKVSGRPVDPAVGADGALYVSDDYTGVVYRVAYGEAARSGGAAASATRIGDPFAGIEAANLAVMESRGAALWSDNRCATCHVATQATPGAYKPLENLTARYSVDTLAAFLRTPQPPMPVFPFDDQQRRDLAVYVLRQHR